MQLIRSTGHPVTISPMRVRFCPPRDLMVLTASFRLAHAANAVREDNVLTPSGEDFLIRHGLLPQLFDDTRVADVYPQELTLAEAAFVRSSLADAARDGKLLDVGCGVGRLLMALRKDGLRIDGVDISPSAIAHVASVFEAGASAPNLYVADIASFEAPGQYTGAFAAMNSVRYLGSKSRFESHLDAMSRTLVIGAPYLVNLSFPSLKQSKTSRHWHASGVDYTWADGFHDPLEAIRDEQVSAWDPESGIRLHEVQLQFSPTFTDFVSTAEAHGWECDRVFDAHGRPFHSDSVSDGGSRWILMRNVRN